MCEWLVVPSREELQPLELLDLFCHQAPLDGSILKDFVDLWQFVAKLNCLECLVKALNYWIIALGDLWDFYHFIGSVEDRSNGLICWHVRGSLCDQSGINTPRTSNSNDPKTNKKYKTFVQTNRCAVLLGFHSFISFIGLFFKFFILWFQRWQNFSMFELIISD